MTYTELKNLELKCRGLPFDSVEHTELNCIHMINSILAYDCDGYKDAEKVIENQYHAYHNYLLPYVLKLGRERVLQLIDEQIKSIIRVDRNVYVDMDGLSYNSIVWEDEILNQNLNNK